MKKLLLTLMACFVAFIAANAAVNVTTLYAVGDGMLNGQSLSSDPGSALSITTETANVFTFEVENINWVKFSDSKGTKSNDWDTFNNNGICKDAAPGDGNYTVPVSELGQDIKLWYGYSNNLNPPTKDKYKYVITLANKTSNVGNTLVVTAVEDVVITYPNPLYVLGDFSGQKWNPSDTPALTTDDEGIYSGTITLMNAQDGYGFFSFCSELSSSSTDWSVGTRYGAVSSDYEVSSFPATETVQVGSNAFKVPAGTYDINVNLKEEKITITAQGETETNYYVAGDFDGWSSAAGKLMEKQDNGTYTTTIETLSAFKITTGKWKNDGGTEYCSNGNKVTVDETYNLATNLDDSDLTFGFGAVVKNAVLTFNPEGPTLVVTGNLEYPDLELYVTGDAFGGWNFDNASYKMDVNSDNTVYTMTGIATMEAGQGFKISTTDWTQQVGGTDADEPTLLSVGSNPVKQNGNNMALSETLNNVTLTFNVSDMTLKVEGTPLTDPVYYVVGNFTDNWATFQELNKDNNYSYQVDGEIINFKITNSNGWNGEEYGANANGDLLTINTPYALGKKTSDFTPGDLTFGEGYSVKNGTITLNPTTMEVTVTGDLVQSYAGWYFNFMYEGNEWSPNGVEGGENVSVVTYPDEVTLTENQEFLVKIWNGTLSDDQYYLLDSAVTTGDWVQLSIREGMEGNAWIATAGTYNVSWDFSNHSIKFELVSVITSPDITIDDKVGVFTQDGTVSDGNISIQTDNWDGAYITVAVEGYDIYYKLTPKSATPNAVKALALDGYQLAADGKIFLPLGSGVTETAYDLSLYASKDGVDYTPVDYTATIAYNGSVGVDGIGAEADAAEYFTLQGVKVAHPEKGGIYIKVANGKAVKVVL